MGRKKGEGFFDNIRDATYGKVAKLGKGVITTPGRSRSGGALSIPGRKMGGAWYNNWNDFKNGARKAYSVLKPIHSFIRDNKLISRGASAFGKDDIAKSAASWGYGIKKKRSKRC